MKRSAVVAAALVLLLTGCAPAAPPASAPSPSGDAPLSGTLAVFAAASLTETFGDLAAAFEAQHPGVEVVLNFGGSSTLAAQIVEGAPADVFAAANASTMQTVIGAGLVEGPATFATNTLEIVVPAGNPAGVRGLADLARDDLTIALCAAEVPCGAATAQVLDAAEITARPATLEQDVRAVLTKVRLGEVDAGLVYRTDVAAAGDDVEGIEFAEASTAVNDYPIGVIAGSPDTATAEAFVAFVRSPAAGAVFERAGFGAAP